eukprot:TRINITY_DN6061_c0_g2_i2.p1 TRINITY_DN6061_c0_g2~~TRINITY_DN6061_c0_g2_i2.p1  ORF type:complete len:266 (+),score=29.86 TRINITY_DN6061_c0_g2_i2:94-798(+)
MSLKQLISARVELTHEAEEKKPDNKPHRDRNHGVLSECVVIHVALGIAAGLQHLHQHFIVHRDVKPDNILLYWGSQQNPGILRRVNSGQLASRLDDVTLLECVPIVADLGESIHRKSESFQLEYQDGFNLGGAFAYLPPEIRDARVDDELDYAKSDVYGLGCVMYEMMERQPVLPISSFTGLTVRDLPNKYSQALRELVVQCTTPRKEERCSLLMVMEKLVELQNQMHEQEEFQ